jgi:hypothetical protein
MFLSIFKMMLNVERCSVLPSSTVLFIVEMETNLKTKIKNRTDDTTAILIVVFALVAFQLRRWGASCKSMRNVSELFRVANLSHNYRIF